MPNDIKLISGTSHPDLALQIGNELGLPLTESEIVRFGNENILFQCNENVRESDVFVIQTSCPPVSDGIVELLIIIDALKHASAKRRIHKEGGLLPGVGLCHRGDWPAVTSRPTSE